ncbi:hypothetical protein [uncultured Aquimarina sp.]|uniref:hypothetical protein n=1 Tax=uncultured Aquimarina sp. TaxID=575652 RepID=UPI002631E3CB|nr:hypothetical protein [uncultured Aquimarina sp.]
MQKLTGYSVIIMLAFIQTIFAQQQTETYINVSIGLALGRNNNFDVGLSYYFYPFFRTV